jgi:hypothetical protein
MLEIAFNTVDFPWATCPTVLDKKKNSLNAIKRQGVL